LPLKTIKYFTVIYGYESKWLRKGAGVKADAAVNPLPSQASLGQLFIADFVTVTEALEKRSLQPDSPIKKF